MKGLALFLKLLSLVHCRALVALMLTNVDMGMCSYPHTPGIHKKEQIEAWKPVVKVRAALGAQLPCTYSLKTTSATAGRCLSYMLLDCRLCTRRGACLCASSGTWAASRTRVCFKVILAGYA